MSKRRYRLPSATYREAVLVRAAQTLLDGEVATVAYPGGRSRESYRLVLSDGRTLIATRRDTFERARREAAILDALGRHDVPVPALLGDNRAQILLQQALEGTRLSRALADADARNDGARVEMLLGSALDALSAIHVAASVERLEQQMSVLGESTTWREQLIGRPAALGRHLGIPAPPLDVSALLETIAVRRPRFVKWDARPGNALVAADDTVHWFDWEHAGCRNRLDDLVWVLGDEFVPDEPASEARLLARHLPEFADGLDDDAARRYIATYGCLHIAVRLGLILKHVDDAWWDLDRCIAEDRIGVTLECALRLSWRGSRWAAMTSDAEPLADWFAALPAVLERLCDRAATDAA